MDPIEITYGGKKRLGNHRDRISIAGKDRRLVLYPRD
jgi:hypothetical protein